MREDRLLAVVFVSFAIALVAMILLVVTAIDVGRDKPSLIEPAVEDTFERVAKLYPEVKIGDATRMSVLMDLAYMHAKSGMAATGRQSHDGFDERARIMFRYSLNNPREICAESWKWQEEASDFDLWKEAFKSWKASRGHWDVLTSKHTAYGYAKAKGSNGIWYFCVITGE